MKMSWKMHRAKSLTGGGATCEFVSASGQTAVVTIRGLTGTKALAHLGAMERLLNGAMVFDGDDLRKIRESLDTARGLAGELAPEHTVATLAVAAIERTRDRVFDAAFPGQPTPFLEGVR